MWFNIELYIYIYIYRQRCRENADGLVYPYIYIYIYRERKRWMLHIQHMFFSFIKWKVIAIYDSQIEHTHRPITSHGEMFAKSPRPAQYTLYLLVGFDVSFNAGNYKQRCNKEQMNLFCSQFPERLVLLAVIWSKGDMAKIHIPSCWAKCYIPSNF